MKIPVSAVRFRPEPPLEVYRRRLLRNAAACQMLSANELLWLLAGLFLGSGKLSANFAALTRAGFDGEHASDQVGMVVHHPHADARDFITIFGNAGTVIVDG